MKNLIYLLLLMVSITSYGQKFVVTPNGLRDGNDNEKTFLVIEIKGFDSKQLYDKSVKFINEKMANPKECIKSQIENEYLRYNNNVSNFMYYNNGGAKLSIAANFAIELRFKDEKIKYEIINLEMIEDDIRCINNKMHQSVLFSGGIFQGYVIYNKKGTLFKEEAKQDIEIFFNSIVKEFIDYMKGENKNSNW